MARTPRMSDNKYNPAWQLLSHTRHGQPSFIVIYTENLRIVGLAQWHTYTHSQSQTQSHSFTHTLSQSSHPSWHVFAFVVRRWAEKLGSLRKENTMAAQRSADRHQIIFEIAIVCRVERLLAHREFSYNFHFRWEQKRAEIFQIRPQKSLRSPGQLTLKWGIGYNPAAAKAAAAQRRWERKCTTLGLDLAKMCGQNEELEEREKERERELSSTSTSDSGKSAVL